MQAYYNKININKKGVNKNKKYLLLTITFIINKLH